jgi:hypothetical protein
MQIAVVVAEEADRWLQAGFRHLAALSASGAASFSSHRAIVL